MYVLRSFIFSLLILVGLAAGLFLSIGYFLSPQDKLKKADVIIAVSGGETDSRTKEAASLYKQGYAPKLILSGAAQDPLGPSNAAAMRQIAINLGVPPSAIQIEEDSRTTAENALAVAPMVRRLQAKTVILVTSPYHQKRASLSFSKALGKNVKIINHSAPDKSWRKAHWWATDYSYQLTLSELQKTLYVMSQPELAPGNP
ncbi:MAG TPA: YdcF family protein [Candidatus Dormibacteraeota bacterium]|nr:YdcF family protein [Candidatus Dormibacteraeota bacterium]